MNTVSNVCSNQSQSVPYRSNDAISSPSTQELLVLSLKWPSVICFPSKFHGAMTVCQHAISWTCTPFCQLATLSTCHLSTCHFVNLPLCQLVILSTCHFVNLPLCQLATLSTYHFVNLPLCQLATLSTCHFVNLPLCQLATLSTCHFVNS